MKKRKQIELEPMPRYVKASLMLSTIVFIALVFITGKYYLPNWKGSVVFLPFALFVGLLLVAAVISLISRLSKKR